MEFNMKQLKDALSNFNPSYKGGTIYIKFEDVKEPGPASILKAKDFLIIIDSDKKGYITGIEVV